MIPLLATAIALAQSGGAASRHPAGAQLYLEIPDARALAGAYARGSYGQVLGDPDLHAALARIVGEESGDPLERIYDR